MGDLPAVETPQLPTANQVEEAVQMINEYAKFMRRLIPNAISMTNPETDWTKHGDGSKGLYIQSSGAMKVNIILRISVTDVVCKKEEMEFRGITKELYFFEGAATYPDVLNSSGQMIMKGHTMPCKATIDPDEENAYIHTHADVWKKGYSQLLRDAVVKMAGLEGITEDMLGKVTNGTPAKVKYNDGAQGGSQKKTDTDTQKEMRHQLQVTILALAGSDNEKAMNILEEMTAFETKEGKKVKGKREMNKLTSKQLQPTWDRLCKHEIYAPLIDELSREGAV